MRISFYVSGSAGRLRKILKQAPKATLELIKIVVCDNLRNEDLHQLLSEHNIKMVSFDYKTLHSDKKKRSEVLSDTLNSLFKENEIDYCFCFGEHILNGQLLKDYKNKIINFHPSILPMFPGLNAIDQALDAGAKLLGNTAHFIDEGIDTGPIIMQNIVTLEFFEKHGYDGVLDQQITLFNRILDCLINESLLIEDRKVILKNYDYSKTVFFPE
jgi:phosphoribosylglycinamide formyltransferase (GART) (GAR transformylase) (5'-phosphoribosylglycinamide transformylase)